MRFLDVRASVSPKIERLSRNSFAGFMVDYHVSAGYGKRVAFGVGVFDRERRDNAPHWGRNAVPDQYVDLGRSDLYRLDLRQFAPPGWDGNVWFTLVLQHAGLGTYATAQLTPLAKEQERKPPGPPPKPRGALLPKGQEKPLDLPVKPTWRTTGEYPLIAGVWAVVQSEGRLVTIVQHEGDFVATTTYKAGEETVTWRAEGKISKSGHITMSLVHTHPHPPDKWLPQTRTAVLGLHGKSLEGYAAFKGGGHKFVWRLGEPREAEKKELPKMTDVIPEIFHGKGEFRRFVIIDGSWYRRMTRYWNGEAFVRDRRNALLYAHWGAAQDDLEKAWAAMRSER